MITDCEKNILKYGQKVSSLMNIESDSKPVYDDNNKYIKRKIKILTNKQKFSW